MEKKIVDFNHLVSAIKNVHDSLSVQANKAVNVSLTLRNWLIGAYIAEYKLHGADRAVYGDKLFTELAEHLAKFKVSNCNRRQLYRYLRFYRVYPGIVGILSPQLREKLPYILPSRPSIENEKVGTVSPQFGAPPEKLVHNLSYSHIELLVDLDDEFKRAFYETECIRGNWSVRELKRQIASLYYERTGLSRNKKKLAEIVRSSVVENDPQLTIRDPYVFEFLGLKPVEVMSESDLENQLLDKLQQFLLELGHGFCFEARQKRILIGNIYNFVDLVFYHRILKCHVLIELKVDAFSHEYIGQLNTYVSWYKENVMRKDDNPPVGILLCTQKDQTLVEYALAGMDNNLFVSKYRLELPSKEDMQRFLEEKMKEFGD